MQQDADTSQHDDGPWRDGWYVVSTATTPMPKRCLVCGEDVGTLRKTAVMLPRHARGIISGSFALIAGERVNVSHGRCERHRTPWSYYLGIVTGVVCIASLVTFAGSMYASKDRFGPLQAVLITAFGVSAVIMVWFAMTNLRIEKTDGRHIWIGGFGRGFRDTLPQFRKAR